MKRILLLFGMIVMALSLGANGVEINGVYYELNTSSNTASVTYPGTDYRSGSTYPGGTVVIPSTVTYDGQVYTVTAIGNSAFRSCTTLTSISFPSTLTSIGSNPFSGCTGLTSVTLPNSLMSLGSQAFFRCSNLQSINLPTSMRSIGNDAFYGCESLTSITIPGGITFFFRFGSGRG